MSAVDAIGLVRYFGTKRNAQYALQGIQQSVTADEDLPQQSHSAVLSSENSRPCSDCPGPLAMIFRHPIFVSARLLTTSVCKGWLCVENGPSLVLPNCYFIGHSFSTVEVRYLVETLTMEQ